MVLMERYVVLIILLIVLNEGLFVFLLMVCMLLWFAIYYHALDNVDRFKVLPFE